VPGRGAWGRRACGGRAPPHRASAKGGRRARVRAQGLSSSLCSCLSLWSGRPMERRLAMGREGPTGTEPHLNRILRSRHPGTGPTSEPRLNRILADFDWPRIALSEGAVSHHTRISGQGLQILQIVRRCYPWMVVVQALFSYIHCHLFTLSGATYASIYRLADPQQSYESSTPTWRKEYDWQDLQG